MHDVYIAFNSWDRDAVKALVSRLKGAGFSPWDESVDMRAGYDTADQIESGLKASRACLLCIGPGGLGPWQRIERSLAIRRKVYEDGYPLVVVYLPGSSIPGPDDNRITDIFNWVDFHESFDHDLEWAKLVDAISHVRRLVLPEAQVTQPKSPLDSSAEPQLTILCDFDGTMTVDDTTDSILEACADGRWRFIESDWKNRLITTRECMVCQTMCIPVERSNEIDRYLSSVALDETFDVFARGCQQQNVELIVNSDGYDLAITKVLERAGLGSLPIKSNHLLKFEDGNSYFLHFPFGNLRCNFERDDPQGTCKCDLIEHALMKMRGVVVIGNDRTDCCVAKLADFVYVRLAEGQSKRANELVRECAENNVPYRPFDRFSDILDDLPALIRDYRISPTAKKLRP